MGYPPLENLLPKSGYSIYKLVRLASVRAAELAEGSKRLVEKPSTEKTTTIALEEIGDGKVVIKDVAGEFIAEDNQVVTEFKKSENQPAESQLTAS